MNTNTARILGDTQKQKDKLVRMLRPLVSMDKVVAMVSNYWGHNGWEEDATTANPWIEMARRIGLAEERIIKNELAGVLAWMIKGVEIWKHL